MFKSFVFCFCIIFAFELGMQFTSADHMNLPVPYVQLANKSIYFGVHFRANFYEAASFCQSHGMRSLTVDNENENSAIVDYIRTGPYNEESFWTSGNDLGEEGVFTWLSTGERLRYTNWLKGQPNNSNNREHCLHYWAEHLHGWNDAPCSLKFYFLCEMNMQPEISKHCLIR